MLQPFAIAEATLDAYRRYVRSSFPLRDDALESQRERLINQGLLWQDEYVSLGRPGTSGPDLASLDDLLLEATLDLPWGFDRLYEHQHRAIRRLAPPVPGGPQSTLVLSGTGSGKTESFLIPIVDACLRDPGPGVKAVVVYPMNALANDQLRRLGELLGAAPDVTFGRYTGDTPETDAGDQRRDPRPASAPPNLLWSRQAMRETPPNILLTNYTMLELLLLRGKDAELFRYGRPLYLVVDEIHLFAGVLGAEVACLLRRLRQHVGAAPGEICCVGTSATAGEGEEVRLLAFAERFFGTRFEADAAVAEVPAPLPDPGPEVPPAPALEHADLDAAHDATGLAALATKVLGVKVPADDTFGEALGRELDRFAPVSVVERALAQPAPVTAAAHALGELPERAEVDLPARLLEARALLLLGQAGRIQAEGEPEPQPRFRPRVHQVVRSLAGLWRCLDPACGRLTRPGEGPCSACGAATLPLASCRTCGEAYWSSPTSVLVLEGIDRLVAVDRRRSDPAVFLADPNRLDPIEDDDQGHAHVWERLDACPACAAVSAPGADIHHDPACPTPGARATYFASLDGSQCPSCGDKGRPILLPFSGSAAASVAVLTQSLSDELRRREGEAGGRLLVFADSRQDAGQQAGYADDQGARIAVRTLAARVLVNGAHSLPTLASAIGNAVIDDRMALRRWLIGEEDRRFSEISDPSYQPSSDDERHIRDQLAWDLVLELTERSRRRFSLEQEGVVVVSVDRLDSLVAEVSSAWPGHPFRTDETLREVIRAVVDILRYGRAVDHRLLRMTPRQLVRQLGIRIGDRAVTSTRGWAATAFARREAQVDLRAWTSPRNETRVSELVRRVLRCTVTEANDAVDGLVSRLAAAGILSRSRVEGRTRHMLDASRLVFELRDEQPLWRCDRCGVVRPTLLATSTGDPLCSEWRCKGVPRPHEPTEARDFYRRQYLAEPRRLLVREHSGQIEGQERVELERRFNDRENPTIDALACTPTLEVGVSLDDLHGTILRNLPPTPANYAQRVGRAGRRSKVALALAHAGQGPHDSWFFDRPGEMIAGLVRAPAISLENEPLVRRHINSLVLETLGIELPLRWVPPLDDPGWGSETIADHEGVLRESAVKPLADELGKAAVRERVDAAVRGAFVSPEDPAPPAAAARIAAEQVDGFVENLRVALRRWCDRYRAVRDEYLRIRAIPVPSTAERDMENRLRGELERLAAPKSPDHQPLGFLGLVGFLPRYGFTGETAFLHPPGAEEPIVQSASVAVTEYAPENLVYARGRKLKVRGLDPPPVSEESGAEHRENVLRRARRCDACDHLTFDLLEKSCPGCAGDLVGQRVVEFTGVRASGAQITSDDEFRAREDYHLTHLLTGSARESEIVTLGGLSIERTAGKEIVIANRGVREPGEPRGLGFSICAGCGQAVETHAPAAGDDDEDEGEDAAPGHRPRCPGAIDPTVVADGTWLVARLRGDALEVTLPEATRGPAYESWRATLREALALGIRESMDAGRRDLEAFERRQGGEPVSLVVYDTMPGGTGYLPKLFAEDGAGLKLAASTALERLAGCDCARSCHRCLADFWNQRLHELLNRHEVIVTLRRLAEGDPRFAEDPENEALESFLELEFFERLREAKLPTPTLQVVRELGGRKIVRVDAVYRDPDVAIFLDGRAFHTQSREKIESDLDVRNRLEHAGELVLEFTFDDVMNRVEQVAEDVRRGLEGRSAPSDLDPSSLDGLTVVRVDVPRGALVVTVDASSWMMDGRRWEASLRTSNALRLAGWKLRRVLDQMTTDVDSPSRR